MSSIGSSSIEGPLHLQPHPDAPDGPLSTALKQCVRDAMGVAWAGGMTAHGATSSALGAVSEMVIRAAGVTAALQLFQSHTAALQTVLIRMTPANGDEASGND